MLSSLCFSVATAAIRCDVICSLSSLESVETMTTATTFLIIFLPFCPNVYPKYISIFTCFVFSLEIFTSRQLTCFNPSANNIITQTNRRELFCHSYTAILFLMKEKLELWRVLHGRKSNLIPFKFRARLRHTTQHNKPRNWWDDRNRRIPFANVLILLLTHFMSHKRFSKWKDVAERDSADCVWRVKEEFDWPASAENRSLGKYSKWNQILVPTLPYYRT